MNESVNLLGPASQYPLLAFLATHQNLVLLIATFGGMVLLLMAESLWPRRRSTDLPVGRWLNNWLLAYLNFVAVLWLVQLAASMPWARSLAMGSSLLDWLPPALGFLVLLVVLEFGGYWLHRAFHTNPLLWRLHAVHHLDTEVD
jgi:sterol desaturase/sphingolipid hydroxylase (fatty acid hydroxylase superfamily)